MNSVELVKAICKERKIPISKLERDLGYANGYIGQLRKGTFPSNRLTEIAQYLSIPTSYLMNGGSNNEKAPTADGERSVSDDELKFALWGDCEDISDDDLEDVRRYAAFVRERKKDKK